MKIRTGFVSNSSSSNFILAFPYRPDSEEIVFKMIFGNERKDAAKECYDSVHSAGQLANRVYRDIQSKKPATLKEIVEQFNTRFYLHELHGNFTWYYGSSPYFGTDPVLLKILRVLMEFEDKLRYVGYELIEELKKKYGASHTCFENTDEGRQLWYKAEREFYDKNKELQKLNRKLRLIEEPTVKETYLIRKRLALIDAKAFLKDHKNHHIYNLEYEDHESEGSILEHGNIFQSVPHVKVNHH